MNKPATAARKTSTKTREEASTKGAAQGLPLDPSQLWMVRFPKVGRKVLRLSGRQLERDQSLPNMIVLAMEDVTGTHES